MRNKYDDMLDEAEEEAEDSIAEKLAGIEFDGSKLKAAFKDTPEKDNMELLISNLNKSADSKAKKNAWQQFGISAGWKALKLAKNVLLASLVVFLVPIGASAGAFSTKNIGICSIITQKGDILAGGCYEALTWDWGGFNVGGVWDTNEKGATEGTPDARKFAGYIAAFGIRADKAWGWAWDRGGLAKRGVKVNFTVPEVQFGPMVGYIEKLDWVYGGFLNFKWPFGSGVKK